MRPASLALSGDPCGDPGVIFYECNIGFQTVTAGQILDPGEQEGGGVLATDALLIGLCHGLVNCSVDSYF